jgi:hypothetical protein
MVEDNGMTPVNQEMLFYSTIDEQKYVAYFRPFRKGQYGRLMNELFYFHNPNMHFFYFNLTSVTKLLQRFGLRVCAAETIEAFEWITIHQRGQLHSRSSAASSDWTSHRRVRSYPAREIL